MKTNRRAARAVLTGLATLPLALSQAHGVQLTAVWTGLAGGNYATPSSWDIGQIPLNNATTTYSIQIGQNKSIVYNTTGARAIDEFLFDFGSTFTLASSSLILPTDLTVLGRALIAGNIVANNASFTALGAGTALLGDRVTLSASGGGVIRIGGSGYSAKALTGATLLSAAGAGSQVDLQTVQSFDSGAGNPGYGYANTVSATDQGVINLSGVKSLVAPGVASGSLAFRASGGGSINLGGLQQVAGATIDTGGTSFSADGGTITLGALQKVNRMTVSLSNAATMTAGGFAGVADVTNSTFGVSGGSKLNAASLVGTYRARGLVNTPLMGASGLGSLLDLSGLQSLDSGTGNPGYGYANTISATDKAVINLSGVKTLVAPAVASGSLNFTVTSGGSINLAALQETSGLTLDTGVTNFTADGGSFVLGPLQKANRINVNLANGSTMAVGGFGGSAAITNATLAVSGGSRLNAATLIGSYNARGFVNTTLMSASGVGSLLDLSGLQGLDAGSGNPGYGYANTVNAADRALIDLAGVKSLVAPAVGSGSLTFNATSGGSINLSGLKEISGLTLDTGYTNFNGDGGSFVLGPLQKVNRLNVSLANGSTMSAGGFAGVADITNSTFAVSGGSTLNAASLVGTYTARSGFNTTLISAAGVGSTLNLSGLQLIDTFSPSPGFGYTTSISASDKAAINLSGVRTVIAPAVSSGTLAFTASSGASINLASLQTVSTDSGGKVAFTAASGGSLTIGGINAGPGVGISAVNAASRVGVVGTLNLLTGSTLAAGTATRLDISGSFSFQQTVESQVNLDLATLSFNGTELHTLEVGGARLATLPAGSPVLGNFGIGRLQIGAGSTTFVQLVDAIDNGNRGAAAGGREVLYLSSDADGDGLSILNGSTLGIGSLDLYVRQGGEWTHINDRFTGEVTKVVYDQGFITIAAVPEPATWALLLGGLGLMLLRRRR